MSDVNNVLECKEVGGSVEESCAHSVAGCSFFFCRRRGVKSLRRVFRSGLVVWDGLVRPLKGLQVVCELFGMHLR